MSEPKIAPYGSWKSPITSDLIVAETIGLGGTAIEGDDVYWMELRPKEGGRLVVVRRRRTPESKTTDLTPMPFNARTRVHEYGGRAYAVADGAAYFSNFADQRLYRQDPGAEPRPITPEIALRYADYVVDRRRNLLFCVREDHTAPGEAVNTLVTVKCDGDESGGQVIISGNNFYASPRLSPDGSRLAWLTWNHPNMPWDGTELWAGEVNADGSLGHAERVAGGPGESIFQPEWSPDGVLYFVSDRTGWWNLYRWQKGNIEPLCPMEAEFGEPQWNFGMSTYAFESPGRIICTYTQKGTYHLASLDTAPLKLEEIPTPYTDMGSVRAAPGRVLFLAGSPTEPWSIVYLDLRTRQFEVLRRTSAIKVTPGYISTPEEIEFPTEGGLTAHAFFYAPRNRDFTAPAGEKPPLIVMSHGGPTAAVSGVFNPNIQYWTSRGFAVMDVNYGGSTGYGRAYRQRLNGQWGVVDVHDCANGAHYLAAQDRVDGERLIIRGGSAGGYTTLAALTFQNIFKAGASHFGISDLETMTKDTHKFESRYLDTLVAPYPARRDVYVERSPIHFTHRLSSAMILFQGLEDKIVPPDQSEKMFEAVRAKELPVAYLAFEGEQHGFRKAENIKRTLDAELYFYSKVFKFDLGDPVEPVEIENL
jgi:dipeptidyl aminopeptidase/acylaminoacyl peptidase